VLRVLERKKGPRGQGVEGSRGRGYKNIKSTEFIKIGIGVEIGIGIEKNTLK